MITLIGTGHVFNISEPILDIFDEKKPEIICVELDKERCQGLLLKQSDREGYKRKMNNTSSIYRLLARFQDNMAEEYGVIAGQEMLTAINYAQTHQIPLALIDMNAQELFKKMFKEMKISEKFRLLISGIAGIFISKKKVEKELKRIEHNFDKYLDDVGEKFPTIKKVLIDDRNKHMAKKIINAREQYENIIAVLGDGHIPGISKILKEEKIDFETIRLSDLRKKTDTKVTNSTTASFSIEYKNQ